MARAVMKGADKHINRLKRLRGERMVNAANRVVLAGADMIRARAHRMISEGSVSGKGHVPSAPFEPPNRDTGNLQAHIESFNPKPLIAVVTSSARYAAALEFGSSGNNLIERPYMRPARDKSRRAIKKLFREEIAKVVKGSG